MLLQNSMLQYVVLAEVYKENPASLNCALKERSIFNSLSNNSGYSYLILYQNSTVVVS